MSQLNTFSELNHQTPLHETNLLALDGQPKPSFVINVLDGGNLTMCSMQATDSGSQAAARLTTTVSPMPTQPPTTAGSRDARKPLPANDLRRSLKSGGTKSRFPPLQLTSTSATASLALHGWDPRPSPADPAHHERPTKSKRRRMRQEAVELKKLDAARTSYSAINDKLDHTLRLLHARPQDQRDRSHHTPAEMAALISTAIRTGGPPPVNAYGPLHDDDPLLRRPLRPTP